MGSTYERSLVKGVSWEIISFILTLAVVYFVYGNILVSLTSALLLTAIKVIPFFVHERLWKKVRWGKI